MNRMRIPRQHRRHSLPATSTLMPLGFTRGIPEGSDMFQKALEDLCINEPDHGITKNEDVGGFNGLGNIQEGDESDCAEDEDDESEDSSCDVGGGGKDDVDGNKRRHSSPNCYTNGNENEDTVSAEEVRKKEIESIMKTHNKLRLAYFKRHGHWPVATTVQSVTTQRPQTSTSKARKDIAFGTKIPK
ncbi:hypothetical protein ACF0H5_009926 [Mactra antiquata]